MDARLRTIFVYVPKLRKDGYVPFLVAERNRLNWRWRRWSKRPSSIDFRCRGSNKTDLAAAGKKKHPECGRSPLILLDTPKIGGSSEAISREEKSQEAMERNQAFLMAHVAN